MFRREKTKQGFTLMELLVVVAIIGILTSVVLVSLNSAREKGKVSATKAQLVQIEKAVALFYLKNADYPPIGADHCSMCWYWPASVMWATGQWSDIVALLVADGDIGGGILVDEWGRPFLYDKNYNLGPYTCTSWSPICSMGPDGILQTFNCPPPTSRPVAGGDDVCVFMPTE